MGERSAITIKSKITLECAYNQERVGEHVKNGEKERITKWEKWKPLDKNVSWGSPHTLHAQGIGCEL
jgi:hypothetical protein